MYGLKSIETWEAVVLIFGLVILAWLWLARVIWGPPK